MPGYGGYSPYPKRFGGGKPTLKVIHDGLNAQRGSAYSKDRESTVWVENMAIARAIAASWSTAQRLANQSDPARMTDMLPRWEKILAIPVPFDATEAERREEVAARFARLGQEVNHAHLLSECERVLGDFFVSVEYIDLADAAIYVPDGSYPWGSVLTGRPWSSTVAHILIQAVIPSGFTTIDYWDRLTALAPVLDSVLPVWATATVYRAPVVGTPHIVGTGPLAGGWYLDEPNLDILVFAS
jgi:hypothetical protein